MFSDNIKSKLITPYFSLLALVDGIKVDDYSLQAKTTFQKGIAATLFKELAVLSCTLAEKKTCI